MPAGGGSRRSITSIEELKQGLAPELAEELERSPCPSVRTPLPVMLSCGSHRPSWSAGPVCSMASRRPCLRSRWLLGPSSGRCDRYRPAQCHTCLPKNNARAAGDVPLSRFAAVQPRWLSLSSRIWPAAALPDPEVRDRAGACHRPHRSRANGLSAVAHGGVIRRPPRSVALAQKRLAVCSGGMTFAGPRFQGSV